MLDKSKKENSQKDPVTEFFGEPIDVYSTDQAIEDGILSWLPRTPFLLFKFPLS